MDGREVVQVNPGGIPDNPFGVSLPVDATLIPFLILFLATGIASAIAEKVIGRISLGPKGRWDRFSLLLLNLVQSSGSTFLVVTTLFWSPQFCHVVAGGLVNLLGIVIAWTGILIRLRAKRVLGRFFTARVAILPDHRLVEEGPYRLIRHPGYLGALLIYLGLPLSVGHFWAILWLWLPTLAAMIYRIVVEERALIEGLGDVYRQYQARTARLIPHLW
ncbi:MAG TPA: isoprenylcysteine carboxylmethyltransferase family protein [Blastocatellia bacterium]|nr:isoprenylcysteine carboxylmethyltransferase family protein [Blastocatellia bacterium]